MFLGDSCWWDSCIKTIDECCTKKVTISEAFPKHWINSTFLICFPFRWWWSQTSDPWGKIEIRPLSRSYSHMGIMTWVIRDRFSVSNVYPVSPSLSSQSFRHNLRALCPRISYGADVDYSIYQKDHDDTVDYWLTFLFRPQWRFWPPIEQYSRST